jgi:hypothetical protein
MNTPGSGTLTLSQSKGVHSCFVPLGGISMSDIMSFYL